MRRRETAGENLETTGLQLQHNRARDARFLARSGPGLFREMANQRLGFRQRYIALEGVFGGNRLRRPIGDDWVVVDASSQFIQSLAVAAESFFKRRLFHGAQIAHRAYSDPVKLLFSYLAYAGNATDRQRQQESAYVLRLDYEEAVRFLPIRGDLGQELVRRHTGGSSQMQLLADLLA